MNINPNIFRAYDIRGIAMGEKVDLNEDVAYLIGKGVAAYLIGKYKVSNMVVGCDNRLTSEALKAAYIKGLIESGINVTDIGVVTSPMVYWAVCDMGFESGTNITASHNPKEYNGLKIVTHGAHSICGEELQEILKLINAAGFVVASRVGEVKKEDIWPKYLQDITSKVKVGRKLKVAVDCGNATAGKFAPELLAKLGCEVVPLYCELDGNFPNHEANPEELHNMQDLIKNLLEHKCDLGIGFDGDGDRIGVVDEKGHMYSSDYMLLLLARDLLSRVPGAPIVFDVKFSQVVIDDLVLYGATPVMSKTGHSFIENKMKEVGAPLGGEVSGHLFFGENYYGFDDAFLAAAKIIEILSNETHPLSQMFNEVPAVFTTPEFKAGCADDKKFFVVQKLVEYFVAKYPCITIDGVRVDFGDKAWGAVRVSNTSPNLTLRFEAQTEEKLKEIQAIMVEQLKLYPEVSLGWYHD